MHLFVMNVPIWIQTSNLGPLMAEATAQPTLIFQFFFLLHHSCIYRL